MCVPSFQPISPFLSHHFPRFSISLSLALSIPVTFVGIFQLSFPLAIAYLFFPLKAKQMLHTHSLVLSTHTLSPFDFAEKEERERDKVSGWKGNFSGLENRREGCVKGEVVTKIKRERGWIGMKWEDSTRTAIQRVALRFILIHTNL